MKVKRYRMKSSASKKLTEAVIRRHPELGALFEGKKASLEVISFETGKGERKIYLANEKPLLIELESGGLVPYFEAVEAGEVRLPRVIVDLGAVPHIANGADVMGPGIVSATGEFDEGSLVVVVDEKLGRVIAVGRATRPMEDIKEKGKSVKNLHHAGDRAWRAVKSVLKASGS